MRKIKKTKPLQDQKLALPSEGLPVTWAAYLTSVATNHGEQSDEFKSVKSCEKAVLDCIGKSSEVYLYPWDRVPVVYKKPIARADYDLHCIRMREISLDDTGSAKDRAVRERNEREDWTMRHVLYPSNLEQHLDHKPDLIDCLYGCLMLLCQDAMEARSFLLKKP